MSANPAHQRHTLALVDLAYELEAATGGTWETERELRTELGSRAYGRAAIPPPDGRLTLPDGRRALIQLQLTPGWTARQYRDALRQRHAGLGAEIWFICTPDLVLTYGRQIRAGERHYIRVLEWRPPVHVEGDWRRKRGPWRIDGLSSGGCALDACPATPPQA